MKKLTILSAIALSGLIFNTADAQIRVHLGFNFGPRPVVYEPAPVVVQEPVYQEQQPVYDDSNDDYYYLPDVDAYYDVTQQCYFYNNSGNWISAAYLPGEYRDYDWRSARRFEVRTPRPYMHADFYRSRYNGHAFNGWAHSNYDHHFNDAYAVNGNRGYDHRFDNRGNGGFGHRDDQRFDNRGNGNFGQHFDNRGQGGFGQHFDNRGQGGYAQPQENRGGNHQFDNRGQGGYTQPQQNHGNYSQPQQSRGNDQQFNGGHTQSAQPSNQRGGNQRDNNRGGDNRFVQNSPRGGFSNSRMARF